MTHKQPTALSVNLNKIALIRNSREGNFPDVVEHAKICIQAGADGITVHPRPDQRHIRPSDVRALAELVNPMPNVEFNIEGNPFAEPIGDFPGFLELVEEAKPDQCTLVPDNNQQLTSDHGFDLNQSGEQLKPIIKRLQNKGIRVSLFMDPDPEQIALAKAVGADRIELYTGPYAAAYPAQGQAFQDQLEQHKAAAVCAAELGLGLNAGHDLNLDNLPAYREIKDLLEVSIGHALTVDALHQGIIPTVKAYKVICQAQ